MASSFVPSGTTFGSTLIVGGVYSAVSNDPAPITIPQIYMPSVAPGATPLAQGQVAMWPAPAYNASPVANQFNAWTITTYTTIGSGGTDVDITTLLDYAQNAVAWVHVAYLYLINYSDVSLTIKPSASNGVAWLPSAGVVATSALGTVGTNPTGIASVIDFGVNMVVDGSHKSVNISSASGSSKKAILYLLGRTT